VENNWYVYILRCKDDSLYTGIARNVDKRLAMHNRGTGAKYTRGRGPLKLRYLEDCEDHSAALKLEYQMKQRTRQQKLELIREKGISEEIN
jgi:putative endonuclease